MTHRSSPARILTQIASLLIASTFVTGSATLAQTGPAEGREGLVELSRFDPRLKGHYAPKGVKVEIVAAEPTIIDPTGMAFDDQGNLYVAEWKRAPGMFDTFETLKLPEGGTVKIQRRRKATTDVVKRLKDTNGDGVYDSAEVVVEGAEMPSSIFPWKNSLYLTCSGRLERWSDDDGDGKFETKTVIADGFCAFYHHWLSGMTLNADGWFYLTAGDNDNHVVGSDGSRVEVSRCGAIFRCRVDGSDMHLFSMGFRNPYRDVAFNATFDPFHVDNDQEEGSKFQGVRLMNPVEEGDYGWRLRPGAPCCQTDFDRGAVSGELPGKLPIITKTGRGAPAGLAIYQGVAFPEAYRNLPIYPDVFRKLVRAYKVKPQGGTYALDGELTLMTADDDLFRPCQTVVGPDGALYVLDWRSNSGGAGRLWGDGKWGRLYKLTWEGDGKTPALPLKPNHWTRVIGATNDGLLTMITGPDGHEAQRALRELVSRGDAARSPLLAMMNDASRPLTTRLLGLQGARQLWNSEVQAAMVAALREKAPEIRRLAAQALSWEPRQPEIGLVSILAEHLNDSDGHALRDIALAMGRHGQATPSRAAGLLANWLLTHGESDVTTRDAFIRALERLADPGIAPIARLIQNGVGTDRSQAVAIFSAFRIAPAARLLPELVKTPGLTGSERLALVRQFKDIPLNIPVPTQGLADWVAAHPENDPAVKVATLDVCRLAGNPAANLVIALIDDKDESVRIAAAQLAAQSRLQPALDRLRDRLGDPSRSPTERLAMVDALRASGPAAYSAIAQAYQKFTTDPGFRRAALRTLADVDRAQATPMLEAALKESSEDLKEEAVQILGESPQGALILGKAFLAQTLARDELPAILASMRKFEGAENRKVLSEIEAAVAKGSASIHPADLKARVAKEADPWRGLSVYLRETGARCYTCHKIENFGGTVGPALTGVHGALSVDKLIESMLTPSKEIKEGYESYKVELKDGRVLNGIKVTQDATNLLLRDANGQETRVKLADVEQQAKDHVSLMPEGLVNDLSTDELADLIAFLLSKPAQETLRNRTKIEHFLAIGPFATDTDPARIVVEPVDPSKPQTGLDHATAIWVTIDVPTSGLINLRGQLASKPSRAFLLTHLRSEKAQDVALQLGLDGVGHLYLNGLKVEDVAPKAVPKISDHLVHLTLKPGWNDLVVAVDRSPKGDARGIMEIESADPIEIRPIRPRE